MCWSGDDGKKVPRAVSGGWGSSTDPSTWGTYQQAVDGAKQHGLSGVGIALQQRELVGIDLDDVRDAELHILQPWARDLVEKLRDAGAWIEVSQSGTGVHAILRVRDALPEHWRRRMGHPDGGGVECYSGGRYFIVTGKAMHMPERLGELNESSAAYVTLNELLTKPTRWREPKEVFPCAGIVNDFKVPPRTVEVLRALARRDTPYGLKALQAQCAALRSTPEGGRNIALNDAALKLARLAAGGELTEATAKRELWEAARASGLDDSEIRGTLASGWSAGVRQPRSAPEQPRHQRSGERLPPAPAVPATPEEREKAKRERDADLSARITAARAENEATQGWQHRGIIVPEYPALTHALDGVNGWCLLTGGTGVGKTTMTLAAALSVALRAPLADPKGEHAGGAEGGVDPAVSGEARPEHADVVYLSTEMTWAEQYHAMVCMLAGVWARRYFTQRETLEQRQQNALDKAEHTVEQLMKQGRLHLLSATDVQWAWGDDWRHALRGVQDAVERQTTGGRTLLIIDTLATLPVEADPLQGAQALDSFQRDELVVDGCTQLRHWLEGTHSAMLTVTEEAKHLTGSADMHSARGSAAYTYRASQRLALVSAHAERVGTRHLGVRAHEPLPDCSEVDMHILKARQGGHGNAVVPLLHRYTHSRLGELYPHELVRRDGLSPQARANAQAYWTASELGDAQRSQVAQENRQQDAPPRAKPKRRDRSDE
jgi:hypothetical protein